MICCLDMEGVLVPEIWIEVAGKTKIEKLRLTTRDISDYDVLMKSRLKILKENGIKLKEIQQVISSMNPLPGAKKFLNQLRAQRQVLILSDTYYEFAMPLMKKLNYPTLFCNWLTTDSKGFITNYHLRQKNGKEKAVKAIKNIDFGVKAVGDSYNDITMLKAADQGILFNPPPQIQKEFPHFKVATNYSDLLRILLAK